MRFFFFLVATHTTSVTWSAPIEWTLSNVVFDDGGVAFGSFVYDAETDTFTDVYITATGGSTFGETIYSSSNGTFVYGLGNDSQIVAVPDWPPPDPTNFITLLLEFQGPMTDAGGTLGINGPGSAELICTDQTCSTYSAFRGVLSGQISTVPIPAAVWLFFSAVAVLSAFGRKTALQ